MISIYIYDNASLIHQIIMSDTKTHQISIQYQKSKQTEKFNKIKVLTFTALGRGRMTMLIVMFYVWLMIRTMSVNAFCSAIWINFSFLYFSLFFSCWKNPSSYVDLAWFIRMTSSIQVHPLKYKIVINFN